jgi:hypothetical protein
MRLVRPRAIFFLCINAKDTTRNMSHSDDFASILQEVQKIKTQIEQTSGLTVDVNGNVISASGKRKELTPQQKGPEILVPSDECPAGLVACDEVEMARRGGSCPPEADAPHPAIFNNKGNRCYTHQGVSRSRSKLSSSERRTLTKNVRSLVLAAAKLVNNVNNIGHANTMCDKVESMYNSGDTKKDTAGRRAFCGTLLASDGSPRCKWENDRCESALSLPDSSAPSASSAPSDPSELERREELKLPDYDDNIDGVGVEPSTGLDL